MEPLSSSIDLDDGYEDYDEDNDDGEDEYDISDYIKDYDENCESLRKLAKSEMLKFSKAVKKKVPDIKQIANIELKRIAGMGRRRERLCLEFRLHGRGTPNARQARL